MPSDLFRVVYDIKENLHYYVRGGEVYIERESEQRPRRCMPMCVDGWARERDVLELCEKISVH